MSIRAIVFDFDGTMLDTESAIYESWLEIYEKHGHSLPLSQWQRAVGAAAITFDPYEQLETLTGRPLVRDEIHAQRLRREQQLIQERTLQPGVKELIDAALRQGIKLAVASNSFMDWVHGHLTRLGLIDHFETLCTVEQVENPKPAPDLYRLAVDRLQVAPHEAIAIEDSPIGASAALRAGLHTVVVPIDMTRGLSFPESCIMVDSLADMTLEQLLALPRSNEDRS